MSSLALSAIATLVRSSTYGDDSMFAIAIRVASMLCYEDQHHIRMIEGVYMAMPVDSMQIIIIKFDDSERISMQFSSTLSFFVYFV